MRFKERNGQEGYFGNLLHRSGIFSQQVGIAAIQRVVIVLKLKSAQGSLVKFSGCTDGKRIGCTSAFSLFSRHVVNLKQLIEYEKNYFIPCNDFGAGIVRQGRI